MFGRAGVESLLAGVEGGRAGGHRAGHQQRQLVIVAGFERQARDGVGLHDGADLGGLRLEHRSRRRSPRPCCDTGPMVMVMSMLRRLVQHPG